MKIKKIQTPITKECLAALKTGDEVFLSGRIFTARDAAHKRCCDLLKKGRRIPLNLKGAVIYYAGPASAPKRMAIGSCGPTTSSRMDPFTPQFLKLGVIAMIGKGGRSDAVKKAMRKSGAVYFLATGGIGALLATKVKSARPVLFEDLGPEAIYQLRVEDFPLIVGIDSKGNDIYDKVGRKKR